MMEFRLWTVLHGWQKFRQRPVGIGFVPSWIICLPIFLPWPLQTADRVAAIEDVEKRGFATVVALPLKSAASADLVKRRMAEIDANSLLFLDKLDRLTLSLCGETHVFTRQPRRAPAGLRNFAEIAIEQSAQPKAGRVFRTWRREIKVSDMPEAVRASILDPRTRTI
jgi:hypothetical protein